MINFFYGLSPFIQTLIASLIAFSFTTLGAAAVYLLKSPSKRLMNSLLGISAGIMISSAIFSLLIPSIESTRKINLNPVIIIPITIILSVLFLIISSSYIEKHLESEKNKIKKNLLLIISIILHNIPEGMSIGVAFASVVYHLDGVTIASAISLSIAISLQNIPEGAAISIPIYREISSKKKAFLIGFASGIVEPIAALIGAILVLKIKTFLPFLLAFAAGAMLFVVIKDLIPESMEDDDKNLMSFLTILGFLIMLILELGI